MNIEMKKVYKIEPEVFRRLVKIPNFEELIDIGFYRDTKGIWFKTKKIENRGLLKECEKGVEQVNEKYRIKE